MWNFGFFGKNDEMLYALTNDDSLIIHTTDDSADDTLIASFDKQTIGNDNILIDCIYDTSNDHLYLLSCHDKFCKSQKYFFFEFFLCTKTMNIFKTTKYKKTHKIANKNNNTHTHTHTYKHKHKKTKVVIYLYL